MVAQRLPIRFDPRALLVAVIALPAVFAIMLPLVGRDVSDWPVWSFVSASVGALLFAAGLVVEAIRRGVRSGVGAPILAALVLAGSTHVVLLPVYLQVVAGNTVRTVSSLGVLAAAGALLGVAVSVVVGLWLDPRIAAVGGVAFVGAGALLSLATIGSAGLVTLGADQALTGFGLGLVVTVLVREADTVLVFAALAMGTAAGAAVASLLAGDVVAGGAGSGDPAGALQHAVTRVLVGSLVPLAVAVAVASLLPGRSARIEPAAQFAG
jgi:hypothetical protein